MNDFSNLKKMASTSQSDYKLSILFGHHENVIEAPSIYFNNTFEDFWLNDEFVKHMVQVIDNSELQGRNVISPVLGSISVRDLSGGVKACILMYETDELIYATQCGDNCIPIIEEIAKKKNLTINLCHFMRFSNEMYPIRVINSDSIVYDEYSLFLEYLEGAKGE